MQGIKLRFLPRSAKTFFIRWFSIAVIASTLFSLIGYLGEFNRYLELTSHFKVQYLVIGLCSSILFCINRRKRLLITSIICILINTAVIIPWYISPKPSTIKPEKPLQFILANLNIITQNYSQVIAYIKQEQPDFVALLEVDKVGLEKLTAIHDTFPYSLSQPREDSFGIAIYSKLPLSNASVKFFGLEDIPSLVFCIFQSTIV